MAKVSRETGASASDATDTASTLPKWGLTVYRVRFSLDNRYRCFSDVSHTDKEEAQREAEILAEDPRVSLLRVTAERDLLYGP